MKRLLSIAVLFAAISTFAQDAKKEEEYNTVREFRNKVFTVQNREPNAIASAVKLLGSGFKGAGLSVNSELRTITVRDFPENVAAIEEAIKRLDQRAAPEPNVELKISVLIGSKMPLPGASAVPEELASVLKQLQATLSYTHYALMTSALQRTKPGRAVEGSGVAEPWLLGLTPEQSRPIFYTYRLQNLRVEGPADRPTLDVENFNFSMRVPIDVGGGSIQYQSVGFETPVSVRQSEKVVIGTTTMRDKALVVVVTAKVD